MGSTFVSVLAGESTLPLLGSRRLLDVVVLVTKIDFLELKIIWEFKIKNHKSCDTYDNRMIPIAPLHWMDVERSKFVSFRSRCLSTNSEKSVKFKDARKSKFRASNYCA